MRPQVSSSYNPIRRIRFWYAFLVLLGIVFLVRLFYLQIIKHDYYQTAALSDQLKQYELPAERGTIEIMNGDSTVSIVLNEVKYNLIADPQMIDNPQDTAARLIKITEGDINDYLSKISDNPDSRYEVLAKRLTKEQQAEINALELKGIFTRAISQRTYPQGSLASQLLGFVNHEDVGVYGVEQALDEQLRGEPGQLKAITDARGVPLPANKDNINKEPKHGDKVVLTIDLGMQQQLEAILKNGVEKSRSNYGSAVIIEVKTGAIKAMSNYPTYNPSEFFNVPADKIDVFQNGVVSQPLEVGSIMKPLTMAAAIDLGVINRNTTYYDPGQFSVDGATIVNVEESGGRGQRSMGDILQKSLNTGATWMLMQMGGGEINERARKAWHGYMTERYGFGRLTGVEQGYEAPGVVPDPQEGFGLNIQFANTAFGQGMRATPLQMAAALSGILNGGVYNTPTLVDRTINYSGKAKSPSRASRQIVQARVGADIKALMEYAFSVNHRVYGMQNLRENYAVGGKTGTAQVPRPEGGYYDDRYNGMFMGFVGGDEAQYVIVVRVDEPKVPGYAGSKAAGPIFVELVNNLIDNFGVKPKS